MSQAALQDVWLRTASPAECRERVRRTVAALTRARRLQLVVDYLCAGLFAGLAVAAAGTLFARLAGLPVSAWQLAAVCVAAAVAVALAAAWRRHPGPLEVAIRADIALKLKQRLSTAWELDAAQSDPALIDRLAVQAVRAGLPARPAGVFPLRVNRWGLAAPLALAALLLVNVADLEPVRSPLARALDERVVAAGQRLETFARGMLERSQRNELPRARSQAQALERLGARMESGGLARDEALEQLRRMAERLEQERAAARAEPGRRGGQPRASSPQTSAALADVDPRSMLDRLRRGAMSADDRRALSRRLDDLERAGIPRRELEEALDGSRAGGDEQLREILEKLAQVERALKEDEELRSARAEVRRAQDHLGDPAARPGATEGPIAAVDWDEDEMRSSSSAGAAVESNEPAHGAAGREGPRTGSQGGTSAPTGAEQPPIAAEPPPSAPVLAAEAQKRPGPSATTEGRTLPRINRPKAADTRLDARFESQVEAVVTDERYPEHYKAFVRRYFLNLSASAEPPAADPRASRGAP